MVRLRLTAKQTLHQAVLLYWLCLDFNTEDELAMLSCVIFKTNSAISVNVHYWYVFVTETKKL